MEIKQLRQFVAAAETNSFSRGAERAFVSQPTLSASIANLEKELCVKLFTRNKRSVVLTNEGAKLLHAARNILQTSNRIKSDLSNSTNQQTIKLGTINTVQTSCLVGLIRDFATSNPDVNLEVFDGVSEEIDGYFSKGKLDVSILPLLNEEKSSRTKMDEALFRESYVLAISEKHRLRGRKSITLDEVASETLITRSQCEYRQVLARVFRERKLKPKGNIRTSQEDRALELVREDLGVAIIPNHYVAPRIIKLPFKGITLGRTVGLRVRKKYDGDALKRFVEFAKSTDWPS